MLNGYSAIRTVLDRLGRQPISEEVLPKQFRTLPSSEWIIKEIQEFSIAVGRIEL
jgi:hypothetical protein